MTIETGYLAEAGRVELESVPREQKSSCRVLRSRVKCSSKRILGWNALVRQPAFWLILFLFLSFAMAVMHRDVTWGLPDLFSRLKWIVLAGFVVVCAAIQARHRSADVRGVVAVYLGVFVALVSVSTLTNCDDMEQSIQRVASFVMLWMIAFCFPLPADPRERVFVWSTACLITAAVVVLTSCLFIKDKSVYFQGRFWGITGNANTLGSFSALLTVGAFALGLSKRGLPLWFGLVAMAGVVLWLTESRTAIAAAVAGMLAVTVVVGKRRLGAVVLAGAVGYAVLTVSVQVSNMEIRERREFYPQTRMEIWERQLEAWRQSPWIGHGLEVTWDESKRKGSSMGRQYGESSYFDLMAAGGVFATVPLFAGLVFGMILFYRQARCATIVGKTGGSGPWLLSAFGMTVVILINSIGEGYMAAVGAVQPIFVWVMLGAVNQIKMVEARDKTRVLRKLGHER